MQPILKPEAGRKTEFMRAGMRRGHLPSGAYGPAGLIIVFCAIMSRDCLAGDNAQVVSESVPVGTHEVAGTVFTEVVTMKNTGTTVWSPGASGYTLNLVGNDELVWCLTNELT